MAASVSFSAFGPAGNFGPKLPFDPDQEESPKATANAARRTLACIDNTAYRHPRGLDNAWLQQLIRRRWLDEHSNGDRFNRRRQISTERIPGECAVHGPAA